MRTRFLSHARWQMKERGIDRKRVLKTLKKPGQLLEDQKGRKIAQRVFKSNRVKFLLRVIFEKEKEKLIVVTVYRTSKIDKYWVEK